MLSKNDFLGYMEQIKTLETDMLESYAACWENVEDPRIKRILRRLLVAENNHRKIIKNIGKLFLI